METTPRRRHAPAQGPSSTATAAGDNKLNASDMTAAELRTHVERCRRLVERPQLLERLPDGGESIRNRLDVFTLELQKRESDAATGQSCTEAAEVTETAVNGGGVAGTGGEETYASNVAAIMEKHKDYRVPVEETVRRMYGGSLSEREIARILDEVPPGYFLTYGETVEREREMARQARRDELAKLRQQSCTRK